MLPRCVTDPSCLLDARVLWGNTLIYNHLTLIFNLLTKITKFYIPPEDVTLYTGIKYGRSRIDCSYSDLTLTLNF